MKLTRFLRVFACMAMLGSAMTMTVSCKEDDDSGVTEFGTITGTVTDDNGGAPIAGITVTVSGMDETATTGNDGKYTVTNVPVGSHAVTFSKAGWLTISATVVASKFDANRVAIVNMSMQNASARITGRVLDARNSNAPLAGADVSVGPGGSATTGADGSYIIENLVEDDYTVTFTKANYKTVEKTVKKADFVNEIATVADVIMGGDFLLPEKTAAELADADKWYFDEYKGGRGGDDYPHFDWSVDYMSALDFYNRVEEQGEGLTLRLSGGDIDLDVFNSYMYGSKKITADNKILTIRTRTHNNPDQPTYFGVQVVDLSAANPEAVKVGDNAVCDTRNYTDYDFDLSAYVGKEVIIAIGIYRAADNDVQFVIRRIAFAPQKTENWDWLPGTEVTDLDGWHMTREMVRSMMANPLKSFTGISSISGGSGSTWDAQRAWRALGNHVALNWQLFPVKKDPEPFASEGFIIKTRGSGTPVSTTLPEAYFAAKFAIAGGNNQLTLKTRNFGSNYTFFKLTAIKEDGTVSHLAPASNTATEAVAADDGCWKFKHNAGGPGAPDTYASFVYDLSSFNGSNVVLCLGVFKGENNSDESKVCIYSISLN